MAEVTGPGVIDMKALAVRLKGADKKLQRNVRKRFKDAAAPVVAQVQASALSMPVAGHTYHDRPPSLLEAVAGTVYSSTSITRNGIEVHIISSGKRMPKPFPPTLPELMDRPQGWSHPVFAQGARFRLGRSHARKYRFRPSALTPLVKRGRWTWAHQEAKPHWFEAPIQDSYGEFRRAADQAISDTGRELEG
jgi:hypothetical protein